MDLRLDIRSLIIYIRNEYFFKHVCLENLVRRIQLQRFQNWIIDTFLCILKYALIVLIHPVYENRVSISFIYNIQKRAFSILNIYIDLSI